MCCICVVYCVFGVCVSSMRVCTIASPHLHVRHVRNSIGKVCFVYLFVLAFNSSLARYTRAIYLCHSWPLSSEQYSETHTVICRLAVKPF